MTTISNAMLGEGHWKLSYTWKQKENDQAAVLDTIEEQKQISAYVTSTSIF